MAIVLRPNSEHEIERFGNGDPYRAHQYALMIGAFLESKPPNTKRTYKTGILQFFELFDWICPEEVSIAHAAAYKKWLVEYREYSNGTATTRMAGITSLFEFFCLPPKPNEEPLLKSNPFKGVSRKDIAPTPYARAKAMDWDKFCKIIEGIPSDAAGMRDKAILLFLAFTGRRRTEVANLRVKDLDLKADPPTYTARVKGGREKRFQLPSICIDAIQAYWLAAGRLSDIGGNDGVFTATHDWPITKHLSAHDPLSDRMMNYVLSRHALRAGVDMDDVRIHAIRHMSARDLDAAGVPLQDIQAFLGHASPVTTQIYLDRLSRAAPAHEKILMAFRKDALDLGRRLGFSSHRVAPEGDRPAVDD
jgi:integrase